MSCECKCRERKRTKAGLGEGHTTPDLVVSSVALVENERIITLVIQRTQAQLVDR